MESNALTTLLQFCSTLQKKKVIEFVSKTWTNVCQWVQKNKINSKRKLAELSLFDTKK